MLVSQLQGVDDSENFLRVTTSRSRVVDDSTDLLLGINEEDSADRQSHALGVDVGGILVIDHVVQVCDLAGLVCDDGEGKVGFSDFVDIFDPFLVGIESVGTQANEFNTSLGELGFKLREGTELH